MSFTRSSLKLAAAFVIALACSMLACGWLACGSALIAEGSVLTDGTSLSTAGARCDAVLIRYPIVYELNEGTQATGQRKAIANGKKLPVSKLKAPKRAHFKFAGWYADKNLTKRASVLKGTASAKKRTVYARWKRANYVVVYHLNGGEFTSPRMKTVAKGSAVSVRKLVEPERDFYNFAGWYADEDLTERAITVTGTSRLSERTLYARWRPVRYEVDYRLNGGTFYSDYPDTYKVVSGLKKLPVPVREGYSFLGWYADRELTERVTSIPAYTEENVRLYAKWRRRIVVAHRGYFADGAPQNSLRAFEAAAQRGFTHVETDIRFTKDDVPVLNHNATIRVYAKDEQGNPTGEPFALKISDVTLDELQNDYRAVCPSGSPVPVADESEGSAEAGNDGDTENVEGRDGAAAESGGAESVPAEDGLDSQSALDAAMPDGGAEDGGEGGDSGGDAISSDSAVAPGPDGALGPDGAPDPLDAPDSGDTSDSDDAPDSGDAVDSGSGDTQAIEYRNVTEFSEFVSQLEELNLSAYVELKEGTRQRIYALVQAVDEAGLIDRVRWTSSREVKLGYAKEMAPNGHFGYLVREIDDSALDMVHSLESSGGVATLHLVSGAGTKENIKLCKQEGIAVGIGGLPNELYVDRYGAYPCAFTLDGVSDYYVPLVV